MNLSQKSKITDEWRRPHVSNCKFSRTQYYSFFENPSTVALFWVLLTGFTLNFP